MRFVYKSVESSWKWRIYTRLQSTQLYNCGFILFGLVIARYILYTLAFIWACYKVQRTQTRIVSSNFVLESTESDWIFFGVNQIGRNASLPIFFRNESLSKVFFGTRRYLFQNTSLSKVHIDNKTRQKKNTLQTIKINFCSINLVIKCKTVKIQWILVLQRTRFNNDEKNCQFMHMSMPNNGNWYYFFSSLFTHSMCVSISIFVCLFRSKR